MSETCGGYHDPRRIAFFWAKVPIPSGIGECWNWTAYIDEKGYGRFFINNGMKPAHRFAYLLINNSIPKGKEIDHLCRNRRCVNPYHLEAVTHRENTLRGNTIASTRKHQTHCKRGHPLEGTNLVPADLKDGRRRCKICHYECIKLWKRQMRANRKLQ